MSKTYSIKEFTAALNRLADDVRGQTLKNAALAGGLVIEANAKMNASGGRPGLNVDTGNLVNSINTKITASNSDSATVEVGTNVEYAAIHEYGGVIKPIHAKRLHFVVDGQHRTAASVTIPARPYMRPAIDNNEADITAAIVTQIQKAIDKAL